MGNSQAKEARGRTGSASQQGSGSGTPVSRVESGATHDASARPSHRFQTTRRGSRPDFSTFLGLGNNEPDVSSLEARRENKQEREARKAEKERQSRLKERERSMMEEHIDGGYLVTQGVYVGVEDYNKGIVRQLMIERRLAPFWRGLNDFSESWAEHQIMAAARGMKIPPADEVPPELEYTLSKKASPDVSKDKSVKGLTIPIQSRSESFQSDSGRGSPVTGTSPYPLPSPQASTSPGGAGTLFRARAKTLASLGSASKNNSEKEMSPREFKLPEDPFVNGQPVEVFLYKDASECPICFLYYPPYLNTTRCCEQAICSECFVQIKRPDPHPPEHNDPDPNAPPMPEEDRQAQAEGLLVSEVSNCPYCKTPEFGITYSPPPFRRGLTYGSGNHPYQAMSAMSSQTSVASSGLSPGPGRRRGTSLSANAPEVITTDKIRPDWANKLAAARAHAARRSAAASALHAAAYLMNDANQRPGPGPFGRRTVLRRSTLGENGPASDAQTNALAFLTERHGSTPERGDGGQMFLPPPRGSSSRRSRIDDLEDMMMMEAIRLSLAAEEERRKKEEKEAKKKAKKEEKEQRKADKVARRAGPASTSPNGASAESAAMQRTWSNMSSPDAEDSNKGKGIDREAPETEESSRAEGDLPRINFGLDGSPPESSQESLAVPIPTASEPFKRSHLRQMSNASSASSSFQEPGSNTPPANEPMFNFQSLAAMIGEDDKTEGSSHVENAEETLDRLSFEKLPQNPNTSNHQAKSSKSEGSALKNVISANEAANAAKDKSTKES